MKTKMAIAASLLLVSVQTASAQFYSPTYPYLNFYYQYWDVPAAENDLSYMKALRDKARMLREMIGTSDSGARLRFERECTRAIERGVEDSVRRSYGCGD